jgi:GTP-binding protein
MRPTVAIVGRPNVGKSTLFNRLAGKRLAIVDDRPGVTRDRREAEARIAGFPVLLVDTAGFEDVRDESLEARMRAQTEAAIADADVTLFVIDARAGVTPADETFAALLRRAGKPVILVANKTEGRAAEAGVLDAFSLGLGDPLPVSAEHGLGMGDIDAAFLEVLPQAEDEEPEDEAEEAPNRPIQVAIIGRPNVGKSTLVNRLIGAERLLTGPEAGITRDAIAVEWPGAPRPIRLYDTAGMRRKARIDDRLEKASVADTLNAVRFAEVVVLLIDAAEPLEKQELQIADLVEREGRALVIAVNKIDQTTDLSAKRREIEEMIERLLPQVRGVPIVFLSGLTGRGVDRLAPAILDIYDIWNRRVATAKLNRWLEAAVSSHPPPAPSGRRIKIRYMTQPKARPPSFVVFCSRPEALPDSYKRYLVNGLRETFRLHGVPIRIALRRGENPYAAKRPR